MTDADTYPAPPPTMDDLTALLHRAAQVHHGLTADAAGLTAATAYGHLFAERDDQAADTLDRLDDAALRRAVHAADLLAHYGSELLAMRAADRGDAPLAGLRGLAARQAAA